MNLIVCATISRTKSWMDCTYLNNNNLITHTFMIEKKKLDNIWLIMNFKGISFAFESMPTVCFFFFVFNVGTTIR